MLDDGTAHISYFFRHKLQMIRRATNLREIIFPHADSTRVIFATSPKV